MHEIAGSLKDVNELIRLAVAPIFLLTGVATTLLVLIHRLARIVDRGRKVESMGPDFAGELAVLETRARLIYRALFLGVTAALCVSFLMTAAFAGSLFSINPARPVAVLFLLALFAYTGVLLCLLREVFLAVGSFRLGIRASR